MLCYGDMTYSKKTGKVRISITLRHFHATSLAIKYYAMVLDMLLYLHTYIME